MNKKVNVYSFNEECYVYLEDYNKLQQENKQLKEVIDKEIEFINLINGGVICSEFEPYLNDILKILNEVSE